MATISGRYSDQTSERYSDQTSDRRCDAESREQRVEGREQRVEVNPGSLRSAVQGVETPALHESVEANAMPDLRALEALDWAPECDAPDCNRPAAGIFACHHCQALAGMACVPCHDEFLALITENLLPGAARQYYCVHCRRVVESLADIEWRPL